LAAAVMMLALAGCPPKTEAPESTPPVVGPKAPAAPAAPQLKGSLTVKGSDTMVNLVGQWAEAFQKEQPGVQVSVNGGGSGTGVAALINGTTDIASSSRDLKDDEKQKAQAKSLTPTQFTVARDAVSIVVNPANPLTEITMEQLAKIYTGATTNWKQLGGPDQKIIVLSRESSSGTYAFFQEHVMKKKDYTKDARLMPATSAIIEAAAQDKGAIGYVGLGYAVEAGSKVKVLKVKKDDQSPAVAASEAAVKDGSYSIARALYLFTAGQPSELAKAFIDFCKGPEGQQIVKDAGFVTAE
jgi:phosphate transport system substrate-binding protein